MKTNILLILTIYLLSICATILAEGNAAGLPGICEQDRKAIAANIALPITGKWTQKKKKQVFEGTMNTGTMSLETLAQHIKDGQNYFGIFYNAKKNGNPMSFWLYPEKTFKVNKKMTRFIVAKKVIKGKIKFNKKTGLVDVKVVLKDKFYQKALVEFQTDPDSVEFEGFILFTKAT